MTRLDPILTPRLVVDGADRAIDVYRRVLGAEVVERFATEDGRVVHAAVSIRGARVAVVDEDGHHNRAPTSIGGSPVILVLSTDDPDAVAKGLVAEGGRVLIPVDDQFYGFREGRVVDPFGHVWIVSKRLERLDDDEIQARVNAWAGDDD